MDKGYFKKGNQINKGRYPSQKTKDKMRATHKKIGTTPPVMFGKNHPTWKGQEVGYRGLHYWIRRVLGIPLKCKKCGKVRTTPKSVQWANKSHKYLRNKKDWISLCVPCHRKYDRKKI
jgi:hypothetical protein